MKLFGLLRKPDWESKDAALRLRAVQSSQDPVLIGKLAELVQTDPDPAVRAAALRRIDDPVLLERRLRGELDASVAAAARRRLGECLCDPRMTVESGSAVLLQSHDAELLAQVAEHCPLPALRRIALERSEKPGLLVQRCIHDPDPQLRLWLLDRIESPDALRKIAEASRRRDKRLTRAARDKLESLQLAAGDADTLQRRALALCDLFGQLARELPADREQRLATLRDEWRGLRERVGADLQRRTDGALAMADAALAAARGEPITRATTGVAADSAAVGDGEPDVPETGAAGTADAGAGGIAEAATDAAAEPALDALLQALPAFDAVDFEQRADAIRHMAAEHPAGDNRPMQAQQRRIESTLIERTLQRQAAADAERRATLTAQLEALEMALQDGSVGAAREARERIEGAVPRDLQRRLAAADERLTKLERWQRWSGSKVRARLCDEAEALQGSGVHPDALANKVKDLKAEWARLDALEGAAAPGPEHGLSRRFRALCHQALAPARPYFEKRRELRGERSGQIAGILAEAAELPTGIDALLSLRKRLRDCFPELDDAAPEKRGEHGRQLRDRLAAIDAALKAQRQDAALGKQRLIARLRRDLGSAEPADAIALAKRAQAEWKRAPRADREIEDTLWTEFRALIDPLFDRVREQEDAARTRAAESASAATAILEELDALADAADERLLHAAAHLESLQARWRALSSDHTDAATATGAAAEGRRSIKGGRAGSTDRRPTPRRSHPLDARFEEGSRRVDMARLRAERARDARQIAAICEAGALLSQAESADGERRAVLLTELGQLDLPADAREPLGSRLQALRDGSMPDSPSGTTAELLAVRAELAAGIESPAAAATLRRQEQMHRLAAKLGGQLGDDPIATVRAQLIELQALPGIDEALRRQCEQRVLAAYRALVAG